MTVFGDTQEVSADMMDLSGSVRRATFKYLCGRYHGSRGSAAAGTYGVCTCSVELRQLGQLCLLLLANSLSNLHQPPVQLPAFSSNLCPLFVTRAHMCCLLQHHGQSWSPLEQRLEPGPQAFRPTKRGRRARESSRFPVKSCPRQWHTSLAVLANRDPTLVAAAWQIQGLEYPPPPLYKLRPCPSYSGRRDRNNSVHWRSLYKGGGYDDQEALGPFPPSFTWARSELILCLKSKGNLLQAVHPHRV